MRELILSLFLFNSFVLFAQGIVNENATLAVLPSTYYSSVAWTAETYIANYHNPSVYGVDTPVQGTPPNDSMNNPWYALNYSPTNGDFQWEITSSPYYQSSYYGRLPATVWCLDGETADIYLRREFVVTNKNVSDIYLATGHDDGPSQFYINGTLVYSTGIDWSESDYVKLTSEQKALIKTDGSTNVIAVHVHNSYGGCIADCGLYGVDLEAESRGNLPFGYNSPWTARLLYNAEGGYNESSIHGWERLYEALEGDIYQILLPTVANEGKNARLQFKTPITVDPSHTYKLSVKLNSSENIYGVLLSASENENDNNILYSTSINMSASTTYSFSKSEIQGISIEDLKIELQLPTTVANTILSLSDISFYDQTDEKELFVGSSFYNWCYYVNPQTGERIKDMTIEGRTETLSWTTAGFDDSQWREAPMPIGNDGYMSGLQTIWQGGENNNYWIRRDFTLNEVNATTRYLLKVSHDDAYELYVNGQFIASGSDWTNNSKDFETFTVPSKYLNVGENVIAIYIQQNYGGCFYDCCMEINEDFYDLDADQDVLEINEVQVSNIDQFIDYSYNYGGWIELYNPSDKNILLDWLYVSDDKSNTKKFRLPDGFGTIVAKGYKTIFFGNNATDGNYGDTAFKQVNFKLNAEGGTIFIANIDGEVISEVDYPSAIARCSYARIGDQGYEWGMTGEPTPGESNSTSTFATERLAAPEVSPDSRLFTIPFTMNISIPNGATLRYTTDGSTPTLTNGVTINKGTFTVASTKILRFRLFEEGKLPSQVITRSYIYQDKDYYLPVVAITTADANLYDDTIGVYVDGTNGIEGNNYSKSNLNMDWKRPVNFEYITADNKMGVNMEVEFAVSGGWSRHYVPASFKLKASRSYEGQTSIDYPFFSLRPYNKYKEILIRNGGNDNDSSNHGRVRDAITQQTLMTTGMYVDAQDYQPVHLFMNGKYMGMLNLREPNNRYHGTANYGYDDDEMDAFEYSNGEYHQIAGTRDQFDYWVNLASLSTNNVAYETLRQEVVDMDEFINYWAAFCHIGSGDWIMNDNNLKGYRTLPDGRFHLTMYDVDWGWNTRRGLTNVNETYANDMLAIYNNLKKNSSFARQFVDAFCIMGGSVFTSEHCKAIGDSICNLVEPALRMENREPWTSYNEQYTNMTSASSQRLRIELLREYYDLSEGMSISFQSNVPSAAFRINGQYVPTGKFAGTLFAPVEIEASAGAGYNFVGWQRTDLSTEQIISTERTLTLDTDNSMNLLAVFEPVSDALKVAAGAPPVVINEVSAGNSIFVNEYIKRNDWVELYNTTDEEIDVEGMYLSDNLSNPYKYQITSEGTEASTLIAPHGYLIIWADKLSPITQLHSNFNLGNNDDEIVMLSAKDFSWTDTLKYVAHLGEESVGRYPDGGKRVYKMSKPSIAATNWINTYAEWVSGEDVNYNDGTRPAGVDLKTITERESRVEYYTTDGIRLESPRRGVNIVRKIGADGVISTRRVIVK